MRRRTMYAVEFIDGKAVYVSDPRHSMHEQAKRESEADYADLLAAERVRLAIEEARDGGYINAWYFYVNRRDVERLINAVAGPE